ncbi:hypothetical protein GJ496_004369 [Pomphorhynchus laevis]|nr:hypothetical protein GJ496_004369 [Pomphorhynchus laevis]
MMTEDKPRREWFSPAQSINKIITTNRHYIADFIDNCVCIRNTLHAIELMSLGYGRLLPSKKRTSCENSKFNINFNTKNTSNECNTSIGHVDGYASTILHEEALYLVSKGLLSVRHTRDGDMIPCSIPSIFSFCSELDCKGWLKIWMRVFVIPRIT